jgi:hypothetical protein
VNFFCTTLNVSRNLQRRKEGLVQIFHPDRDEEAAKADGIRLVIKADEGCMRLLEETSSSTKNPSPLAASSSRFSMKYPG